MKLYIGYDERLDTAWNVAAESAQRFGCEVIKLREDTLRLNGMLTRPVDTRHNVSWDLTSSAPQSTAFAITRFAVPLLAHTGWAAFVDSDFVFLRNPMHMLDMVDDTKAVWVVKHRGFVDNKVKMDGQKQTSYPRKNWSSLMLWNCDHVGTRRLNLAMLNQWPGRDLHAFKFLADSEIGALPPEWNHLVDIDQERNIDAINALHYTRGTPDMEGYEQCGYAEVWRAVASEAAA